MGPSIGIALIARNVEATIKACLDSFVEQVDQTVVVLAGESTDKTEEIVRSFRDKVEVHKFDWIDDFAAARNFSFSKLKTDFWLWVDADDEVYQAENLREIVSNLPNEVGAVWFPYHYAIDEFGNLITLYERERLLRASYHWLWRGRLHETVSALVPCKFVRTDHVIIRHNHLGGQPRNERNFRILNIMLKEAPNDKRIWLYLGHQNFATQDWMEAAKWYLQFGCDEGALPLERYQALCYCVKAMNALQDKQAVDIALLAIDLYPQYKDAYLELAHTYFNLGEIDKAIHFATLADMKEIITEPPHVIFINPLEYTFNRLTLLGECFARKQDLVKAIGYFKQAYAYRPITQIKDAIAKLEAEQMRNRVADSIKVLAVHLLNTQELVKLPSLLKTTPYWFRDTEDYKQLKTGVDFYTKELKSESNMVEEPGNGVIINVAQVDNIEALLEEADKKYDKVTIVSPYAGNGNGKQINTLSQSDLEHVLTAKENRHILDLRKEATRIWASYDKKMPSNLNIRLFLGQGLEVWNPDTIKSLGCGGSETWAAKTAEALAQKGCLPFIYAMDNQVWDGVIYRPFSDFKPDAMPCHLFISSRVPEVFNDEIPAVQKWLWFHDIHRWNRFTPEVAGVIDVLVVLSQWHANFVKATYPFMRDAEVIDMDKNKLIYNDCVAPEVWFADAKVSRLPKMAIIGNGIDTTRFEGHKVKRNRYRFIWCSSPDRGLEELLNLWPLIRKELPDAELKIFYGWEYFNHSLFIPEQRDLRNRLLKLIKQDGVEWCGRVGQKQLAEELFKAGAMVYPPPHQFRETYGIAFLEAQAAGAICFYRQNGALGETIGERGVPLSMDSTPEAIVRVIVDTLHNRKKCFTIRTKARDYALKRSWDSQAEKVLTLYRQIEEMKQ